AGAEPIPNSASTIAPAAKSFMDAPPVLGCVQPRYQVARRGRSDRWLRTATVIAAISDAGTRLRDHNAIGRLGFGHRQPQKDAARNARHALRGTHRLGGVLRSDATTPSAEQISK